MPEVESLVSEVRGWGRGHVLEVVITRPVIQTGLAVTVTVTVSAPDSLACDTASDVSTEI